VERKIDSRGENNGIFKTDNQGARGIRAIKVLSINGNHPQMKALQKKSSKREAFIIHLKYDRARVILPLKAAKGGGEGSKSKTFFLDNIFTGGT